MSLNQSIAERLFDQAQCDKYMVSFKHKGEPAVWYNGELEPNVGTCIFLEVC